MEQKALSKWFGSPPCETGDSLYAPIFHLGLAVPLANSMRNRFFTFPLFWGVMPSKIDPIRPCTGACNRVPGSNARHPDEF